MPNSQVTPQAFLDQLKNDFNALNTRQDLARMLDVSDKGLRHLLYATPKDTLYCTFEIYKKTGGVRTITTPVIKLKSLQKRLLKVLTAIYIPKKPAHGFVKTRGICSNAKVHIRKKYILNIDLKDFFSSINFGRVRGIFLAEPYNCKPEIATVLAQICCYNNELPQGAPTSPIISNMICVRLDSHLMKLAAKYRCSYTRYADDITISSNQREFPPDLARVIALHNGTECKLGKSLKNIIKNNGFQVNSSKIRIQSNNERQIVTGLITNKKVNIPRQFIRNVRAMLFNWETNKIAFCQENYEKKYLTGNSSHKINPLFKEMLRGKIDFIGTVRGKDDSLYLKLLQRLAKLDNTLLSKKTLDKLKQLNDRHSHILDRLFVIETTAFDDSACEQGTGFHLEGYGIVTCAHILLETEFYIEVYSRGQSKKNNAGVIKEDKIVDLAVLNLREYPEDPFKVSNCEIKQGDQIWLAGFPKFGSRDTGVVEPGYIIGEKEDVDKNPRILISATIISGNSGGPVFDKDWNVIGVAAKGRTDENSGHEFFHEVIPISSLKKLGI